MGSKGEIQMKYEQAGTYEIKYKAVDECGNETTATRTVVVETTSKTLLDTTNVTIPLSPDTNDYALASTVSNGDTIQLTLKGAMMEINDYTTFAADEIIKSWEIRNNEWFSYIPEIDQGGDQYHFFVVMVFDGNKVEIYYWCDNELMEKPTSFKVDELIIERI